MCFTYSKQSSNKLDSIAAQIQGLVGKVQSFLDTMEKYSTPKGINQLEKIIMKFESGALQEVEQIIEAKIQALVNSTGPRISTAVTSASHQVGEELGGLLGNLISTPLGSALKVPLQSAMRDALDSPEIGDLMGEQLSEDMSKMVTNLTSDALANKVGTFLENLVEDVLEKAGALLGNDGDSPALLQNLKDNKDWELSHDLGSSVGPLSSAARSFYGSGQAAKIGPDLLEQTDRNGLQNEGMEGEQCVQPTIGQGLSAVTGAWSGLSSTLLTLTNLLPQAVNSLVFAKKDVTSLAFSLDTVFVTLKANGPDIFDTVAGIWNMIWAIYFVFLLSLGLLLLYYAFWSGGYFGGPRPVDDTAAYEPARTWSQRFRVCCCACCDCMTNVHDTQICFWSFIIFALLIVLVVFVVSIVLSILAGVKFFLVSTCADLHPQRPSGLRLITLKFERVFEHHCVHKRHVTESDHPAGLAGCLPEANPPFVQRDRQ
jgi:hypothetical protein